MINLVLTFCTHCSLFACLATVGLLPFSNNVCWNQYFNKTNSLLQDGKRCSQTQFTSHLSIMILFFPLVLVKHWYQILIHPTCTEFWIVDLLLPKRNGASTTLRCQDNLSNACLHFFPGLVYKCYDRASNSDTTWNQLSANFYWISIGAPVGYWMVLTFKRWIHLGINLT